MVRSIVGMEQRRPAGALCLLQGKIEIGQPRLIEEIAISVGQVGPEEYRCVIDNGTQLVFSSFMPRDLKCHCQLRSSLRDSGFKLVSPSHEQDHHECKNQEHQAIQKCEIPRRLRVRRGSRGHATRSMPREYRALCRSTRMCPRSRIALQLTQPQDVNRAQIIASTSSPSAAVDPRRPPARRGSSTR